MFCVRSGYALTPAKHLIGLSQRLVQLFQARHTQKRELFHRILGDGDTSTESLSLNASEIFGLFDLKARHGKGAKKIGPQGSSAA